MSKQIAARIGNNTDWIDYIRFDESDPTGTECNKAETGKIGVKGGQYIQAISGPMSCVKCYNPQKKTTDIRLYFVIGGALREAKLADAGSSSDLKGGWVLMPEGGADDMPSVTSTMVWTAIRDWWTRRAICPLGRLLGRTRSISCLTLSIRS